MSSFQTTPSQEPKVTLIWWFFIANSTWGWRFLLRRVDRFQLFFTPTLDIRKTCKNLWFCFFSPQTYQPSIFVINFSAQPKTVYLINLNLSEINWVPLLSFSPYGTSKKNLPGEGFNALLRKSSLDSFLSFSSIINFIYFFDAFLCSNRRTEVRFIVDYFLYWSIWITVFIM